MAKVSIDGQEWEFDFGVAPLAEALALEKAYGKPYAQYEEDLKAGSVAAVAAQVWLIWRRNGRDVDYADILSGEVAVDLASISTDAKSRKRQSVA